MSDDVFDGQILADKLSKLNSSQQSIESLSRMCISQRKKAKQIVETWDKFFKSALREQRVSFLYLANDILQNSRRKGSEFVNEFWKVLPAALKHVCENGDVYGKKAASRLVDIWEERKVFGSRGHNLKDEILGKNPPPPPLVSNGKSANPIKIVKRDSHSLRIKLAVGAMPEKIITAFQSVHDENVNEEAALIKCKDAVRRVGEIEKDVRDMSAQGSLQGSELVDEIQDQENVLQQCVIQLESAEATRAGLVSQLKEALQDQESKLEIIHTQLQVARGRAEHLITMSQRLTSHPLSAPPSATNNPTMEATRAVEFNLHSVQQTSTLPSTCQPVISFAASKTTEEENMKAAAAAVAAKLAASTSSAQMLTSVLSSLVAEEAASMSSGLKSAGFTAGLPMFPPEKRPKLEKPMPISDINSSEVVNSSFFSSLQQQTRTNMPLAPPTSMQSHSISQVNQIKAPFPSQPPPPPPPPPMPQANPPTNQFVQSAGMIMGVMPYGYGANNIPPPPLSMGLMRTAPQQPPPQQPSPSNSGYYRPPSVGFYGQGHQATPPPPVSRQ